VSTPMQNLQNCSSRNIRRDLAWLLTKPQSPWRDRILVQFREELQRRPKRKPRAKSHFKNLT